VHLGAVPAATERAFNDFVAAAVDAAAGLLINGDLFDYWLTAHGTDPAVPTPYRRPVEVLRDAVRAGLRLVFVGGNRDPLVWDQGRVLPDVVGAEVHTGPLRLDLGGWRALVTHGDLVPGATPALARWLRTRVWQRPGVVRVAQNTVGTERLVRVLLARSGTRGLVAENQRLRAAGAPPAPRPPAAPIARWAAAALAGDSRLDIVVAAHSHAPAVRRVSAHQFYVNPGDWIDGWHFVELPARTDADFSRRTRPRDSDVPSAPGSDGAAWRDIDPVAPRLLAWPSRRPVTTDYGRAPIPVPSP
jgi:UDP-2,3-diacylglucosamine pyrophosphatase LpxH